MYHCHLRLYLVGRQRRMLEQVKDIAPLPQFTHEFLESSTPEHALAAQADVILADLDGMNAVETVRTLVAGKQPERLSHSPCRPDTD